MFSFIKDLVLRVYYCIIYKRHQVIILMFTSINSISRVYYYIIVLNIKEIPAYEYITKYLCFQLLKLSPGK